VKKLLLILLGLGVVACSDKVVSKEYYKAHLDEAKTQLALCKNDKDANNVSCENARAAIQHAFAEAYESKTMHAFDSKTENVKDAFH